MFRSAACAMHSGMQVPKYISLCEGKRVFSGPVREYMWVKWCDKLHLDTGRAAAVHQVALMQHKPWRAAAIVRGEGGISALFPVLRWDGPFYFSLLFFIPGLFGHEGSDPERGESSL